MIPAIPPMIPTLPPRIAKNHIQNTDIFNHTPPPRLVNPKSVMSKNLLGRLRLPRLSSWLTATRYRRTQSAQFDRSGDYPKIPLDFACGAYLRKCLRLCLSRVSGVWQGEGFSPNYEGTIEEDKLKRPPERTAFLVVFHPVCIQSDSHTLVFIESSSSWSL